MTGRAGAPVLSGDRHEGPHAHAIDHPLRTRRRRRGRPPAGGCSGWTTGADGRAKTFAFLVNGKTSSTTLKQNVDMLAATVNGCYRVSGHLRPRLGA